MLGMFGRADDRQVYTLVPLFMRPVADQDVKNSTGKCLALGPGLVRVIYTQSIMDFESLTVQLVVDWQHRL